MKSVVLFSFLPCTCFGNWWLLFKKSEYNDC